ncbi:MAG TPA: 16S rRNA (uracil(1498)-N(3))-methyltransferase [Candidatus Caccocola faecipullorum]|nr:16S rRNA (uracil(1498)-N(3))-methyltransferase [Candidatus Caccocola faecipullorum]
MSLPRLRLERCSYDNGIWTIDAEEAHHLVRVRHCYTGSLVEGLLDGEKVTLRLHCDGASVTARELSREEEPPLEPRVELLLGLLKNDQLDEALRFCAETGVFRIHLLICERSVPRYEGSRLDDKMKRWRKILDEATKQAGAATPPALCAPVPFAEFDFGGLPEQRLVALLSDKARPLREISIARHIAAAIGPEGDWSPEESGRLLAENFAPVRLGARIMRASTAVAAFCASAAMMYAGR